MSSLASGADADKPRLTGSANLRRAFAHTKEGVPPDQWEPLEEHLENVGRLAGEYASSFGAAQWGRLAGLWHDIGKYSVAFQHYLAAAGSNDQHQADAAGKVDHSTAGAQHANGVGALGRFLAYVIAGHHVGLPDGVAGTAGLADRLRKRVEPWDGAPADLLQQPIPAAPTLEAEGGRSRQAFSVAFFTRMLFSCLVDADFLATEQFMAPERAASRPSGVAQLPALLDRLDGYLDQLQSQVNLTPVNQHRREILAACRAKTVSSPGFFSLHVPTGGGKTLSSLAFALRHATKHGLRRVVYAIPFTSIIEQTAIEFRKALGELEGAVLEHHSNIDSDDPIRQSVTSRLAAENFDAAIIVTTNVQLFESLFAARTSRCRKLHRLARSVIILDEVQTLPPNLLAPTLAALEELVRNYGATVVLCTATQPAVERREGFSIGLDGIQPIIDKPLELHRSLRRTEITTIGFLDDAQLVGRLRQEHQVLSVVNSRGHSAAVYRLLGDPDALHLSASLCGAHRSNIIAEIKSRLKAGAPCRVVCTQVIEAGVDVDFPVVYRAAAGLDSVAQAAGRCNREGGLKDGEDRPRPGRVVVFDYDDHAHRVPPFIGRAAAHFREIQADHAADLLAPSAVDAYFRLHYWQQGGDAGEGWDRGRGGLSVMRCFGGEDGDPLHHQFRQAAERYRIIDDIQTPILVPYGDKGQSLIGRLIHMPQPPARAFDREAQRYVVAVWNHVFRRLQDSGSVIEHHGRYYLANPSAYHPHLGITADIAWEPESLIQ